MDKQKITHYAFYYSLVRMAVASVALFLGAMPPILWLLGILNLSGVYGPVSSLLNLAWLLSGASVLWLGYQWYEHKWIVFGGQDPKDRVAFAIMLITGLNLGITGLMGTNIGLSITAFYPILIITGIVYLISAYYLYQRFLKHGKQLFI